MWLDGLGVAKNGRAVLHWLAKAANQNHILAINMVGRCYELGWGTPVDKARAAQWYKAAADRGLDWGMYNYATLLALGEGVAEDKRAALDWFRKAAGLGNAKSMNYIGSFYEDGWVRSEEAAPKIRVIAFLIMKHRLSERYDGTLVTVKPAGEMLRSPASRPRPDHAHRRRRGFPGARESRQRTQER